MEVSKETLAQYDSIICVDRSGSMAHPAKGFPTRWAQAKELCAGLAAYAAQVDTDGITVISFGGTFKPARDMVDGCDADQVRQIFDNSAPSGSTPLAAALDAAFAKHFDSDKGKSIIFVFTDGEPDDKSAAAKSIVTASGKLNEGTEIRVLFVQLGDDKGAQAYLNSLDTDLKGAKFDIVNVIDFEGANDLTPMELYSRAINDSH